MPTEIINILLTSFPGLNLPSTKSLPLPANSSINDLCSTLSSYLPSRAPKDRLILITTSNHQLDPTSSSPLSTLLSRDDTSTCALLPLRLTTRLPGGKGGFGSQLRAAGGRMQSRKKRDNGPNTSSNRALGGPRYRVIAEAKSLAEYYATQPERERTEKEEKRKRWEAIVEAAEKKQEEVRAGKGGKGKLDGKWVESKEEAEEKMREAVRRAVSNGDVEGLLREGSDVSAEGSSEGRSESEESGEGEDDEEKAGSSRGVTAGRGSKQAQSRTFFGWDEDEDMSSDDEDADESSSEGAPVMETVMGKGKAKA
ncbi:hypothetical protein EV356DRAFT_581042 [Viridothelium virens]|uniref:Uncharacterized protein n=1 Tax=Viridothelium virens TaxID=1048519 RepID=A0A6A6GTN2_VIRVR|nr:hypothetical protein EV356DRAFT_581042 [Viridothelium virens]